MSEPSRLDALLASDLFKAIRKKHGKTIMTRGTDFAVQSVPRIPTGIFQMDYALGGGFAAGRINVAYGYKSTGKSTTFIRSMANAQKMCANCWTGPTYDHTTGEQLTEHACKEYREPVMAYCDVEGTWDPEWVDRLGLDSSKVLVSTPEFAEQTLDISEALVRTGDVDILVIDSLAFLTPSKEIEESAGKALQAEQARTLGRGVRKFVSAINFCGNSFGRRPTLFFTNQMRHKLGVMFGSPETQPGGFAPGFAATIELKCISSKYQMDETTGRPLHVDIKFRVEKNKSASAHMEGEYRMILSDTDTKRVGDIYDEGFMVNTGIRVGLVAKDGNGWLCLDEKYKSKDVLELRLATEPLFKSFFGTSLLRLLTAAG